MAKWLSLDDLEVYLTIPKSTLYRLVQQGRLPGHKVGRTWRFDEAEIDEWIKAGGSKPGSATEEMSKRDNKKKSDTAS